MPNITPVHLIIILVVALLVLGPGKLPEVGAALGKSIREFRKAASDMQDGIGTSIGQPQVVAPVAPVAVSQPPVAQAAAAVAPVAPPPIGPSDQPVAPAPPAPELR